MTKEEKTEAKENIYTALLKVQAKVYLVKKESENPFFRSKYADLGQISTACRPALAEAGIVVVQRPIVNEAEAGCETILVHAASDTNIDNTLMLPLLGKVSNGKIQPPDPQSVGSCITYARRYSLAALVGIVAADEDDDGNSASHAGEEKAPLAKKPQNKQAPAQAMKDYSMKPVAKEPLKVPFAEDNIPEAYTKPTENFPDSDEVKIRFKYDVDKAPADKIETIESYVESFAKTNYCYLDQKTGIIESEVELPKLKNYQISLT